MANLPFLGTIYPFTAGTFVTMGFWWLLAISVIAAIVITVKYMK